MKSRNSEDINELDDDDVYFHSNSIKNIKLGTYIVNRIYLNNSIVYELQDTINLTKFHNLVPTSATSIVFDSIENQDVTNYNLVGYCDANNNIAVYNNSSNYLILNIRNSINYAPQSCFGFFYIYNKLTSISFNNFNTQNVTNMKDMFFNCSSLTSLDVSSFNTGNVTNMQQMFENCSSLTSLDLSSFNTQNVTTMRQMFYYCSSLTSLDLSSFNTGNVTDMYFMFSKCGSLPSLDVSSFNTGNVTNMNNMFENCSRLTSIISNTFNIVSIESSINMFYGCTSLIGGNGTTYNSSYINAEYARVDGENGLPGYFTAPSANK